MKTAAQRPAECHRAHTTPLLAPRPGCRRKKAVGHQLMENCKFQASILKTAPGGHLFIYLCIHSFF